MYREARLAGVPLNVDATDRGVTPQAKEAFKIAPQTIKAFNDYIAACSVGKDDGARLEDIFREQKTLYVRWRKDRLYSMDRVPSVVRAASQDRTDLINANTELREEARLLKAPLSEVQLRPALPATPTLVAAQEFIRIVARKLDWFSKRGIDSGHYAEWKQLESAWDAGKAPTAASNLFENYVHDSRAWFKVVGDDDHVWERPFRERWEALERRDRQWQGMSGHQSPDCAPTLARGGDPLTILERNELERYRNHGIPTQPGGREPYWLGAGYLRFRRLYFGADNLIVGTGSPGKVLRVTPDGKPLVHALPVGNLSLAKEMMELERDTINEGFLVTLFQILIDTPQMTATEVIERTNEKGILLAPTVGAVGEERLDSQIERELDVLAQQRLDGEEKNASTRERFSTSMRR